MTVATGSAAVPLAGLVDDVQTWNPSRAVPDETFSYIDLSSVGESKTISEPRTVRCAEAPSRARQVVKGNDVLVSTVRPNLNGVATVPPDLDGATASTGFCVLRPRTALLDSAYLFQWVKAPAFVSEMTRRATGASYPAVSDATVRESRIPLPPLPEQRRIAAILDKADKLRAKRQAALEQLNGLTQTMFLEMFGDAAKNDRHWASERLGEMVTVRRGGSPRPIDTYLGGDINWIKIGDGTQGSDIYIEHCADKITRDGLNKTVFLKAGSLIFANCGVSLGFARILKVDGCIHDGWLSFEDVPEDRLDKLFLLKALNSITQHFRTIAPSGTQPNLNTGLMKDFRIILPPIDLQRHFAEEVLLAEKAKATYRLSLANFDALFASLQHRAFSGAL